MTKLQLASLAGLAALGVSAAGAASAQNVTSMPYVDQLQWKINHAFDQGMIDNGQRRRLLNLQQHTHDMAWRCNQTGAPGVCDRVADNVRYIDNQVNGYGYNYNRWGHRGWGWRRY